MANNLYNTMYNPDVLSCIANLSNDEVFTPPEVANAMLDLLPQELFSDPNTTFLDPACKSGVFLREIAKRLLKGLEPLYPDLQERTDHIFKHQLFGIAITELTSHLSRRSLYCSKTANGNYSVTHFDTIDGNVRFKNIKHRWQNGKCVFCGASQKEYDRADDLETHAYEMIHTTKPEEIFKMRFDVIIGNPPYQLNTVSGETTNVSKQAKPIYNLFVAQAKKLNPRFLCMIIPSRWFAGGLGLDGFRQEMMEDAHITHLVDYTNAKDCFPQNSISGGVCYFLRERDTTGLCEFTNINGNKITTETRSLSEFPVVVRYNAAEILDIAMAGTSATLLAKRWESALLVNVDNDTLARLLASEEAMDALMRIEGFRSLNADIETIINKSNAVKKAKRDGEKLTPKEKKELTDAEKEYKSKRKMIQEKLIKFATRVPVFMYLTDYREYSLQDVITQLEPDLFKKVTGLDVKDFELLVSLNVFNEALMNDAVYKFKRYEDASLIYTGIDKHTGENVGLYSTVISRADYDAMAGQLAASMTADEPRDDDLPERPVFTNISSYDPDDEDEDLPMVAEPKPEYGTKRTLLVQPTKPTAVPTYRPAYVPPTPSATPVAAKPVIKIDTSKVHAGTIVKHKAFGTGEVKGIDGGLIVVTFAGVDKKFQFPGAFEQGFLKLDE